MEMTLEVSQLKVDLTVKCISKAQTGCFCLDKCQV